MVILLHNFFPTFPPPPPPQPLEGIYLIELLVKGYEDLHG